MQDFERVAAAILHVMWTPKAYGMSSMRSIASALASRDRSSNAAALVWKSRCKKPRLCARWLSHVNPDAALALRRQQVDGVTRVRRAR